MTYFLDSATPDVLSSCGHPRVAFQLPLAMTHIHAAQPALDYNLDGDEQDDDEQDDDEQDDDEQGDDEQDDDEEEDDEKDHDEEEHDEEDDDEEEEVDAALPTSVNERVSSVQYESPCELGVLLGSFDQDRQKEN